MTASRVVALNHIGISVADLDRARAFWVEALGGHEHGGFAWPVGTTPADESLALRDTAAEVAIVRTDAAYVELFAFSSPAPAPRPTDSPGVARLVWAVPDPAVVLMRLGVPGPVVHCPDGTPVELRAAGDGPTGLVGVTVRVTDPGRHPLRAVPGPVPVSLVPGGSGVVPRPVDLGANHLCLDVAGIDGVRAGMDVRWHHPVTESSGGIAAVCYGTTADGVLVELLESRSPEAFLSRARLARAD